MTVWAGFDPSIAAFGYAVMRKEIGGQPVLQTLGTWRTKIDPDAGKLEDRARRGRELAKRIVDLLNEWGVQDCYIESPVLGMRDGKIAVHTAGRVRGIVEGLCFSRGLMLAEVRPEILKQAVTGRKDASKEQVARVLMRAYPFPMVFDSDTNATDALAVAHVGAHRGGAGVTISSGVVKYSPPSEDDLDVLDY